MSQEIPNRRSATSWTLTAGSPRPSLDAAAHSFDVPRNRSASLVLSRFVEAEYSTVSGFSDEFVVRGAPGETRIGAWRCRRRPHEYDRLPVTGCHAAQPFHRLLPHRQDPRFRDGHWDDTNRCSGLTSQLQIQHEGVPTHESDCISNSEVLIRHSLV